MKKILATILALVLALGLCTSAWATEKSIGSATELKNAISSVNDGDVIKLSNDVTISEKVTISKNIFLDLGTHTLTSEFAPTAEDYALVAEGNVTIQNGSIVTTKDKARAVNNSKGNLNLENVIITAKGQVGVGNSATSGNVSIKNCKINSETAYAVASFAKNANVVMDINKSEMSGAYGAFYHNGTASGLTLSVTETTMSSENGDGMYLAGYAKTTLTDCDISGVTGVEIRAGELTVNGGSITGTATPISVEPNGNGSTVTGAGIAVSQHTTMLPLTVTVNGGNIKGYSAFYQVDTLAEMEDNAGGKKFTEEQVAAAVAKITLSVNEGVYTATGEDGQAVYSENKTGFVSAGIFSSDVTNYLTNDAVAATVVNGNSTDYAVGSTAISAAITSNSTVTVTNGSIDLTDVPAGVTVKNTGEGKVTVNGTKEVKKDDAPYTVPAKTGGYYYYPSTPSITAELNGTNKSATDYPGGDYGLVFRSTAAFSTFQGVQVDGKTLAKSNYTAEEGSTVVYLKAAYLKTLAAGKHTITILSTAGNTSMDFTVGGKSSSPQTFDAGVGIYAVTAVLSVTGMAWTAKKRH